MYEGGNPRDIVIIINCYLFYTNEATTSSQWKEGDIIKSNDDNNNFSLDENEEKKGTKICCCCCCTVVTIAWDFNEVRKRSWMKKGGEKKANECETKTKLF